MKKMYVGDSSNIAKNVRYIYIGDSNNIAKKVIKAYIGDANNIARQFYEAKPYYVKPIQDLTSVYGICNDYFCGMESGILRFYVDTTFTVTSDSDRITVVVFIYIDKSLIGTSLSVTLKTDLDLSGTHNDPRIVCRDSTAASSSQIKYDKEVTNSTYTTYTTTIPEGTDRIEIGIWQGTAGSWTTNLWVSSIKINGEELIGTF